MGTSDRSTLILHWDGTAWTRVPSPTVSGYVNYLYGVAATAANDAWAVGEYTTGGGAHQTLAMHWDGVRWVQVVSPNGPMAWNVLSSVTMGGSEVWALGYSQTPLGMGQPLALRWTGAGWVDRSPSVGTGYNHFYGAGIGDDNLPWAAGNYTGSQAYQTLIMRYRDPCGPVPTATASPTFTSTPPPSPTAHIGQFQDVPPENPFYFFIECMGTRGIISGYTCGGPGEPCGPGTKPYYRPGANLTRGQLAKIVSTAAGLPDPIPSAQQTFTDVPPASPFWLWIERMALHGVISGYADGTFRPNNLVTRGQFAKIISNATQWQDPAPAQPTFADVPRSDPFFVFVERVAAHGAISGYGCNPGNPNLCTGQAEGCPGTYFRPCALATRGQAAKIVTNAFFPNCVGAVPSPGTTLNR